MLALLAAVCALPCTLPWTLPPQSPPAAAAPTVLDFAADTARQVVVDRQAGQYLGHVSTVLLADGATILAVYPMGHGKGSIVMKRSRDGGRTWSERLPLPPSFATSEETPTIFRTRDAAGIDRLILWSGLHPARLAHSADGGTNWSALEPVGDWGGIVVMADVVATAQPGRYLAFWHDDGRFLRAGGATNGTFTLLQSESTDGGLAWQAPRAIWSGSDLQLCEPGAVRSRDGKELLLLVRENARRAPSQFVVSRDDGASWSAPQPLHAALCGDRHVIRRAPDGRLVVVFRAMPLAGDTAFLPQRGDFVAWVGSDDDLRSGGLGRYRVRLLDNLVAGDCGYAGLECLPDGTFVATTYGHWAAGEQPFITSVRFTLAELDAAASSRAPAAGDPAADLELLAAYAPTAKVPTDTAAVAATDRLMRAMPAIVRERGVLARRLAEMHAARRDATPSSQHPIRAQDPLLRVLVRFDDERMLQQPLEWLAPHRSAAVFPGEVPAAALPVACGRIVDLAVPGRHSLGVYARAGEVVTVHFGGDEHALPAGLRLRIGAHSDDIARRDAWTRMPRISRTFAVDRADMRVGSAYGGLVYLEVEQPREGKVELLVEDAVPAALFVLGTTTPDQWRLYVRASPAPWAELATSKVVLTVPSEAIRKLDDPTGLLTFWDRVLDGAADLATRSRERARPERYVADVQISAGAMHGGYPIMTHLDAVADMTDVARMRKGPWGLFHELGHNHQSRDWTFAGTTEVTVNIFSLYLCHVLCDVTWDQAWGGNLGKARERLAECVRTQKKPWGDDGPDAKPDLALRLLMYSQIERGFGWEAFFHTFAEYRDLPDGERPQSDADKRDQWLVRLSKSVDRDLGPFFAAWGVPVSDAARATAAAGRQPWMPDDWPY